MDTSGHRVSKWQLITPFWCSSQRWSALLKLAVYFTIVFGITYISVQTIKLTGDITDTLVGRRWGQFFEVTLLAAALGLLSGGLSVVLTIVSNLLDLQWRTWMTTRLVKQWTASHSYYDIERQGTLSNSDQRISEDVRLFVDQTLNMFTSFATAMVHGFTYGAVLWNLSGTLRIEIAGLQVSIPGYMLLLAFVYHAIQLGLVHWVGKRMIALNNEKQTVEADFRYGAMQLRENAEQIAFYKGGDSEQGRLLERFEKVRQNTRAIVFRSAKVMFTQSAYGHIFQPLPTVAALPRYFAGEITLGGMTQITGAYGMFSNTLSLFSQWYLGITNWIAIATRLQDLASALQRAQDRKGGIVVSSSPNRSVTMTQLRLHNPLNQVLSNIRPQEFLPGQRWLIRGPSGAGKSTYLRAAAGLWPYGEGEIRVPADARLMFLPQNSYIPDGPLRAALAYPAPPDTFTEAQCREALQLVGLEQRVQSLTDSDRWQQRLSGGEQQRLAVARALLHKPDFLFLDEATSALDDDSERQLYEAILARLPTSGIISVAHRSALLKYHDRVLDIQPISPTPADLR